MNKNKLRNEMRRLRKPNDPLTERANQAFLGKLDPRDPDPGEVDAVLYNNRPARKQAEAIGEALKRFNPAVGQLRMTESVILPNGLHRIRFEQRGQVPEIETLWKIHAPTDGRYVYCTAWMDEDGMGHLYLAWNERMGQERRRTAQTNQTTITCS